MSNVMSDETDRKKKIKLRLILLGVIPVIVLLLAIIAYLTGGRYVTTDNAYVAAQKSVITPSVAGRVADVFVVEGQAVSRGDPLFTIDPATYGPILQQADAHLATGSGA